MEEKTLYAAAAAAALALTLFSNVTMRDYVVHMTLIRIDKAIQLNIYH